MIEGRKFSSNKKEDSHDYSEDYLTFIALEDGAFTFTPKNSNIISYSTNGGKTWTEGNSVEVNSGDKVLWKGIMIPQSYSGIGTFSSTAEFDIQGNAMSLLYGDNYKGQTDLTEKHSAFYRLFSGNIKVVGVYHSTKIRNFKQITMGMGHCFFKSHTTSYISFPFPQYY